MSRTTSRLIRSGRRGTSFAAGVCALLLCADIAAAGASAPAPDPVQDSGGRGSSGKDRPAAEATRTRRPTEGGEPDAPLAGPRLETRAQRPTLVERGIDGKVRRPDGTPEEAALRFLTLDDETRARIEEITASRARLLEQFVVRNIDLLTIASTAGATGDTFDLALVGIASLRKLLPLWERGPLREEIELALPEPERARFGAILEEYWNAVVDEHRRTRPPAKFSWFGAMAEERLAVLGKEIERAYQRQEKSGTLVYYYLVGDLGLTPAQERRVRTLITDFTEKGGEALPRAEKEKFFGGILAMLTPEQAAKLLRKVQGK